MSVNPTSLANVLKNLYTQRKLDKLAYGDLSMKQNWEPVCKHEILRSICDQPECIVEHIHES